MSKRTKAILLALAVALLIMIGGWAFFNFLVSPLFHDHDLGFLFAMVGSIVSGAVGGRLGYQVYDLKADD